MGPDMARFQSGLPSLGRPGGGEADPQRPITKPKKVVPVAKQLSNKISACSTKLTEIMAWESKVKDCTSLPLSGKNHIK